MTSSPAQNQAMAGHRLIQLGVLLFLLGLLTGFVVPSMTNPRMGLASHLEGVMNGLFLVAMGLIWPRLRLPSAAWRIAFWLAVYGTFVNWIATGYSAVCGAGAMMPLAGGKEGTAAQEGLISFLLYSLSLAMIAVCLIVTWGLAAGRPASAGQENT